jgi:hypothetical protein
MPIFRTTEKQRYARIKARLFSGAACRPGNYRGMPRSFCLADACAAENLHASLRTAAVRYFRDRAIHWHDGRGANATSADFALRFRRYDGRIELVLGEWKYTEFYSTRLRPAEALNPTQLRVYRAAFAA